MATRRATVFCKPFDPRSMQTNPQRFELLGGPLLYIKKVLQEVCSRSAFVYTLSECD